MADEPKNHRNVDSDPLIDIIAEKLDLTIRLNSGLASFSDLPNEILGEIVGKLDLVSRLQTRKVSRRLRTVVDQQKACYDLISIYTNPYEITIHFDRNEIHYRDAPHGKCQIEYSNIFQKRCKRTLLNGHFLEIAINDLTIALKKPKLQLETLVIDFDADDIVNEKIFKFIESLKSPAHLRSISIYIWGKAEYYAVRIVSMLKPGKLEEIEIDCSSSKTNVDELVKTQQWKQAKRGSIFGPSVNIKDFLHFDSFNCRVESISPQDVILLRDTLSKSTTFEYFCLTLHDDLEIDKIGKALGAAVVQDENDEYIDHRYEIPESNDFLDFEYEIASRELIIEKRR